MRRLDPSVTERSPRNGSSFVPNPHDSTKEGSSPIPAGIASEAARKRAVLCHEPERREQQAESGEQQRTEPDQQALLELEQIRFRGDLLADRGTHGVDDRLGMLGIDPGVAQAVRGR